MNCKKGVMLGLLCLAVVSCSGGESGEEKAAAPAKVLDSPVSSAQSPVESPVVAGGEGTCQAVMEKYCVSCHSVARICQKVGKKSESRWKRSIKRMVKRGSTLPSEKQSFLIDCLVQESDDIRAACQ